MFIFILGNNQSLFAQPKNLTTPVNSPNGKGGVEQNNPEVEYNSEEKGQDKYEFKKMYKVLLQEEDLATAEKIIVNYDSLHNVYMGYNTALVCDKPQIIKKYIAVNHLSRLHEFDSVHYKLIMPYNKLYATLTINDADVDKKLLPFIERIDQGNVNLRFKAIDVINNMLPPLVLINGNKITGKEYEVFITDFFTKNPDLIYFCSKSFAKMIERKQYVKLLKLHKGSENIVDFRGQDVKG